MTIFVLVCLLGTTASSPSLCGTGVPARAEGHSTDIPVRAFIPRIGVAPLRGTGVPARAPLGGTDIPVRTLFRGTGVPARAPLGGTDIPVRAESRSASVPPTTYFDKGTGAAICAPSFALTPSPSPTAWERGVECVRGAARSPSPATRKRGLGGEGGIATPETPAGITLERDTQATVDALALERDAQATQQYAAGLDRDVQTTEDVPALERDAQATGSLWSDKSGSLFEDFKARRVGDLVTIVVVENTTASARANTAVQKSESASTTAGVGPLLNFLWPELGASGRTDSNVQGNTARAGTLQTRITVQVVETFPNGVLRIEGRRTLKINEETQTLVFSGLVRIRDIRADNTVPSTAIANAEIFFEGKGIVGSRQREGILTRLFKIIF